MRVLLTLHNFLPESLYGAERACLAQAREMLDAGHEVGLFYAGNRAPTAEGMSACGLDRLRLFRAGYVQTKGQVLLSICQPHVERCFRRVLREFHPDVVHVHHLVRLSLRLPALARQAGVPCVMTLHDYHLACPSYSLFAWDNDECPGGGPFRCAECLYRSRFTRSCPLPLRMAGALAVALRSRLVAGVLRSVSAFISPCRAVPEALGQRGIATANLSIIPYGQPTSVKRLPPHVSGPIRFGYMGGIHRKKGIEVLTAAFDGPASRQLTIRGFASESDMAAFRSSHPGFEGRVERFSDDLTSFYQHVDVAIVPSVWMENQPLTILESFAAGRPVIASRTGGIPETFKDGQGGFLFSRGNPGELRKVITALQQHPEKVQEAAERIPHWPDWKTQTLAILKVLEAVRTRGRRVA